MEPHKLLMYTYMGKYKIVELINKGRCKTLYKLNIFRWK